MNTIKRPARSVYRQKGSKFLGYLYPVESKEEFSGYLEKLETEYHDATHHCYACRIDPNGVKEFSEDDGEPSGSAGLPILNQLKSRDLVNAGIIVVRYYGGTKLGKSGLIQAYGETARLCLEKIRHLKLIRTKQYSITYPYQQQNRIDWIKNKFNLRELDAEYLEEVNLAVACPAEKASRFTDALTSAEHLGIRFTKRGSGFITK